MRSGVNNRRTQPLSEDPRNRQRRLHRAAVKAAFKVCLATEAAEEQLKDVADRSAAGENTDVEGLVAVREGDSDALENMDVEGLFAERGGDCDAFLGDDHDRDHVTMDGASGAVGEERGPQEEAHEGADGEGASDPDRSGSLTSAPIEANGWSTLSPQTKNACLLANWQANRGKASDAAMQDLLDNVIPQLDPSALPTWRQVPGLIFAADGYRTPEWREFIVCKSCGVTKDGTLAFSHCAWCTTQQTTADEWVSQGCTITHLGDIVASWFRNPEDAGALLAYLKQPEVESSMAHSPRAKSFYTMMQREEAIHREHSDM
jgi:hypothetical protein